MNVSLTPELERFTRSLVESGRYRSASEVVRDSLRLLEEQEAKTAELRRKMQEGLDSGPPVPFDAERLRVVPTGLDWDALARSADRAPDPDGRTRFLFLGTLVPHKGAHVLLDAFARLGAAGRARATLTLHGPADSAPAYVDALEARATEVGAELGPRLDRAGVARALSSHDVLVVPSLWLEVRPLVIVEAYAAGLRVVASDLGGMAELLGEGIGGRTFAAGDAAALADALSAEVGLDPAEQNPAPGPSAAFPTWDAMFDSVSDATEEARALRQDRA